MSTNMKAFQALLAGMREAFLDELPERCNGFETLILELERSTGDRETFNELYRGVHSLKGSGGTHGLSILTTLCHQLENLLSEADARQDFGSRFTTHALAYVDLLRQVRHQAHRDTPDYSGIEADLEALRLSSLQSRKAGLIAESSATLAGFYQQALATLPLQLTVVDNGLTALERLLHEPFDFVIVGRELKELNGIAMMAALRASQTRNQKIPALLVTSRRDAIPDHAGFNAVIARDQNQAGNLVAAVRAALAA
ncbi:MAG: Hpt domain-containing protein [Thiobacillus sp.]|uniref:hybrid sensor histidine kinase/response regulator n=1 Tax=Thiobacillus sp. TaxID=924 RepID=UPI002733E058|nr:hybrid sensor histidine kinase/response regulator [Thiobacillus sp.]MDP3420779.1 Hpt domain-containing protein [Thiobacillus sp.]MDP3586235.1 Hpt domain-containing protein [Thiobacillus sp.]